MKEEITKLAIKLYFDLPFYKRRNIKRWYISNNWDVSHEFDKCIDVARRMIENCDYRLRDISPPTKQ